jgi:hypothetical protein
LYGAVSSSMGCYRPSPEAQIAAHAQIDPTLRGCIKRGRRSCPNALSISCKENLAIVECEGVSLNIVEGSTTDLEASDLCGAQRELLNRFTLGWIEKGHEGGFRASLNRAVPAHCTCSPACDRHTCQIQREAKCTALKPEFDACEASRHRRAVGRRSDTLVGLIFGHTTGLNAALSRPRVSTGLIVNKRNAIGEREVEKARLTKHLAMRKRLVGDSRAIVEGGATLAQKRPPLSCQNRRPSPSHQGHAKPLHQSHNTGKWPVRQQIVYIRFCDIIDSLSLVLGHVLSPVRFLPRHSLLLIANYTSEPVC